MKYVFLILFCTSVFGQSTQTEYVISKYEKMNKNVEFLAKQFDFNNTDTIVSLNNIKFFLLRKDSIILYKIKNNNIIFKKKYSREDIKKKIEITPLLSLNPSELVVDKNVDIKLEVNDGEEYSIRIFKNDKYVELASYSPETYIENKFPFYEKRKLFLDYFNMLEDLFMEDFFLKVQMAKEVFIDFKITNNTSKKVIKNNSIVDGKEIYYINMLMFSSIHDTKKTVNSKWLNEKLVIDAVFINQYFPEELKKLFKENRKKIFIIEKCSKSKTKFVINEVNIN